MKVLSIGAVAAGISDKPNRGKNERSPQYNGYPYRGCYTRLLYGCRIAPELLLHWP